MSRAKYSLSWLSDEAKSLRLLSRVRSEGFAPFFKFKNGGSLSKKLQIVYKTAARGLLLKRGSQGLKGKKRRDTLSLAGWLRQRAGRFYAESRKERASATALIALHARRAHFFTPFLSAPTACALSLLVWRRTTTPFFCALFCAGSFPLFALGGAALASARQKYAPSAAHTREGKF